VQIFLWKGKESVIEEYKTKDSKIRVKGMKRVEKLKVKK
jgi:hypothetical protein